MKKSYCPVCNIYFEYFTTRDFIIHAPCKQRVQVETCEPESEVVIEDTEPEQGE